MAKIKYLIKFVKEKEHAELLENGVLYMQTPEKFHEFKNESGDKLDSSILANVCFYKYLYNFTFCLTTIYQEEIENNSFVIKKELIDHFGCNCGYAVILDYNVFISAFTNAVKKINIAAKYGPVIYRDLTFEETKSLILHNNFAANCFYKKKKYELEKEFRVVTVFVNYPNSKLYKECPLLFKIGEKFNEFSCKIIDISKEINNDGNLIVKVINK